MNENFAIQLFEGKKFQLTDVTDVNYRTEKTSGDGEQVYVNSEFAGGRTNTAKFSLYVSPYLVANQGGRYTKHIYIGSQRIVSKLVKKGLIQDYHHKK